MIILPDRNIARSRILLPMHAREWRTPSRAQPKSDLGHENHCRWAVTAKLDDGHVVWRGFFYDRDDADAFLKAAIFGALPYERELWDLPELVWTPSHGVGSYGWRPGLGERLSYECATQVFLVGTTGSNQTWTVLSDYNQTTNTWHSIGAGASGGCMWNNSAGAFVSAAGGGGGAWNSVSNLAFVPGASVTYQLGTGGTAVSLGSASPTTGNNGGDTWFNGATLGAASVGSKGGSGGAASPSGNSSGGAGGTGASGVGTSSNNGGRGGNYTGGGGGGVSCTTGGGGAASTGASGSLGIDKASNTQGATAGGNSGSGATGGSGAAGGNGTEFSSSPARGAGAGGGGRADTTTSGTGFSGGNYGGGGGGAAVFNSSGGNEVSGAGIQGIVYGTWNSNYRYHTNLPMLGM